MSFGLAIMLLATVGLLSLSVATVRAIAMSRMRRARTTGRAAVTLLSVYGAILLAVSLGSERRVLGLNEPKRFCGFYIDCHVMVSVTGVDETRALGNREGVVTPQGSFYLVTLTISSDARRAPMRLDDPEIVVEDPAGRRFPRSSAGQRALEYTRGPQPDPNQVVEAGASYSTTLVFEVPEQVSEPTLIVRESHWLTRLSELFLIGDEDSLLHEPAVFALSFPSRG